MMRENNSMRDKMIDRNWLLKRKRKQVSCGSDQSIGKEGISPESLRSNSSTKRRVKGDAKFSRDESKLKGNDGYYFECVECDLGGNLLCCDKCPRTYHLECLNPPLKRAPPGKWHCPSCREQKESTSPLRHSEFISKRARTKSAAMKARSDLKLSCFDKEVLHSGRSTVLGKSRSFSKGKSIDASAEKKSGSSQVDASCSTKSSHSSDNGVKGDTSTLADTKSVKKLISSGSRKELQSFESIESDQNAKSSKMNSGLCENVQLENKPTSSQGHSTQKANKKKHKLGKEGKKKSRSEKGKHTIKIIIKNSSKKSSSSPGISGIRKKHSSIGHKISESILTEDHKASNLHHQIHQEAGERDKTLKCDENLPNECQQVDRILGCRVQNSEQSSSNIQTTEAAPFLIESKTDPADIASGLPSTDSTSAEVHERSPHLQCNCGLVGAKDAATILGKKCHDIENQLDRETINKSCGAENEDYVDRKVQKLDFKEEEEVARLALKSSKDQEKAVESSGIPGVDDTPQNGEININNLSDENKDPKLADVGVCVDDHVSRPCQVLACNEFKDNVTSGKAEASIITENRVQKTTGKSLTMEKDLNVKYEFLIKWARQSVIHNSWVPESQLKVLAKRKLENYKARYGTAVINICQEQWSQPQRVIALRVSNGGRKEALVKWRGLPYDECTWERLDEPIIQNSSHLISQFNQFESQALNKDAKDDSQRTRSDGQEVSSLVEQPKELKGGSLFPHQLEALNWLRKCWHKSKNVILADEMGLGKTISACAFTSSLYFEFKVKLPCLVLVPLSTMPNWLAEFALWAPDLNVVEYHGSAKARSMIRQYEWHASDPDGIHKVTTSYKFNVLLTTYEMVLADSSHLRSVHWEVLVVDEGHRLKNSGSKLFSLLNTFSFEHRVLLTGTPLQNNIGEMYNLLNFLQPVSFPSLSAFEEKFNDLTTAEKVEELKKLVAPHMLRRLKKDAMQNIPPKTERMVPVELTSIQAEYYRAMLTKNYQILRNLGKGGVQSMLNIVMQLRKVCNHPYLIPGTEPDSGSVEFLHEMRIKASAKLTLLHSMLKILHKEGHRVLIFSQMTKLLDILEDYLTIEFGPKTFDRVDGSVSVADRQAAITRFNQDRSRFVFLLSTRSCGLGINLATADTVIIYDSDFNPHADIQAMNRAHRIGQSNRLLVYRLVVRASVEERILQLARKKLMLDQLFVNKSESQKEVEDILRWGTEELFSDSDGAGVKDHNETSSSKVEAVVDGEQRHRRRAGGLGDVYQDKCTDGGTKVVWDESAILKLLDRSDLQVGASESVDGEMDSDMLGSVKALEWNDEPAEEREGTEVLPNIDGDGVSQTLETKDDNVVNGTEENEWDRLLRLRWEKYQSEEEAALGRGKRLRKAVSYRETFTSLPSEALSESSNEEEEPEPEYTPAGRALKEKYAKLRARQKERLAQRHIMGQNCPTETAFGPESLPQMSIPLPKEEEGLDISSPLETVRDQASSSYEDSNPIQLPEPLNNWSEPIERLGRFKKHGYKRFQSTHLDLSVRPPVPLSPDIFLPSHQFQSANSAPSLPASNQLPVLGLCAPNASQIDSARRNFHSFISPAIPNFEQKRTSVGLSEFPLPPPGGPRSSSDANLVGRGSTGDESLLPGPFTEAFNRLKNSIPDSYFPFNPHLPASSEGIGSRDHPESSGAGLSAFKEKMGLPDLVFDQSPLSKFPLPSMHMPSSISDVFPSLSLDMKVENKNEPGQDFLNIPLVPNFRHLSEALKQKQQVREPPPLLGLGQMQAQHSFLPENHKKVLDNIMMRTGFGTNRLMKKQKVDAWSEDELDALWIGVRRHGRGNWDAMVRDPKLKFSRHRSSEDLSVRWAEEQLKISDGPVFPVPNSSKSTSFPGVSDGMMTRALFGSKFVGLGTHPPKFRSHLTDIKLGFGDLTSGKPSIEPTDHFGSMAENSSPFPPWLPGKIRANIPGDFGAGPFDVMGKLSLPLDLPFPQNALPTSDAGSLSMNCLSSSGSRQNEDMNRFLKLPSLLDRSLSILHDSLNSVPACGLDIRLPSDPNKRVTSTQPPVKDDAAPSGTKMKNLPHWLREAVSVPASKPPEPCLPPAVSAIAHSVRLLYGEEKPTIPPFTMPGPPPFQPKDPRKNLRKKRKLHSLKQPTPDIASSSKNFDNTASSSISSVPPAPLPGLFCTDASPSLPSINLNLMSSLSPSSLRNLAKKISPSPEVLDFVASSVAPGPSVLPSSEMPNPGKSDLPVLEMSDPNAIEPAEKEASRDFKGLRGKRKASRNSLLGGWGKLTEERRNQVESGESSKTCSDTGKADQFETEEVSSEETVSDGHQSEQGR